MQLEPLSPELALVDPELGERARAALPRQSYAPTRPRPSAPAAQAGAPPPSAEARPYPVWARMTAALWLLVIGMLVGGTAIPHAQDKPRVVPPGEDVTVCPPRASSATPTPSPPPGVNNPFGP